MKSMTEAQTVGQQFAGLICHPAHVSRLQLS